MNFYDASPETTRASRVEGDTRARADRAERPRAMDAIDVLAARVANDPERAWGAVMKRIKVAKDAFIDGGARATDTPAHAVAAALLPIADALDDARRSALAFKTTNDGANARAVATAATAARASTKDAAFVARGVGFNAPRGKYDAHVMKNGDLVLENTKGAQIVIEGRDVRRVLRLETGDANQTSLVVVGLRGEGAQNGKSRLKTLCATFRGKDKLVIERGGDGDGAEDDEGDGEEGSTHAARLFFRALEREYGAETCGTTNPVKVFAGTKGFGHVQATKGFNSGHLFFLKEGVAFGPSPAMYVHFDDLEDLRVLRAENAGSSTFDLSMTPEDGVAVEFSNISRDELEHVSRYLAKRCTSADDAPSAAGALGDESDDDESDEDDEDFTGHEPDSSGDDDDDDDDDGNEGNDMEYSFDNSDEVRGDASDASDAEAATDDRAEKRRRVDAERPSTQAQAPAAADSSGSDSESDDNAFTVQVARP